MKNMKKVFVFMMAFACVMFFNIGNVGIVKATEQSLTPSQVYAKAMQPGWNLGNTFDGYDTNGDRGEESWGNPKVTKELIHQIKAQGFNSIRMPFTTVMRTGSAPNYKIDPAFLARYAEVVNWALDEDLYVMINVHHDSWNWAKNIGSDNGAAMAQYEAIWTQLADYFKDYPEEVCFETLNEPQFVGSDAQQIKINEQVNETCYKIIRKSGGNNNTRMIVMPTLNTNDSEDRVESLYSTIKKLDDPNLIATFHYYGPWAFGVNIAGCTTFDSWVKDEVDSAIDRVYNGLGAKGIGVICGEYGLLGFDSYLGTVEEGEMLKYMEYLGYYTNQKNITMMLWDNGQHLSRTNYTWSDQELFDMIKASWEGRSAYTTSDRIYIKKGEAIKDVTQKLTLNGNTLVSICDANKELVLGQDYTVDGDDVTIKASYLKDVVTNTYGTNTTLTFKFSSGKNWNVYVDFYNRPIMSDAQGTISNFVIPVQYKGDILETFEAVDKNGNAVGPQNWTTYKEFGYNLLPDYTNNTLKIQENFFKETNDGAFTLKMHFLSGDVVNYDMVKNGNSVIGTATETYIDEDQKDEDQKDEDQKDEDQKDEDQKDEDQKDEDQKDEDQKDEDQKDDTTGETVAMGMSVVQSGLSNNPIFTIKVASDSAIDLSKVVVRYYFTKDDAKEMNFWCDNAGLSLDTAPWYASVGSDVKAEFVKTSTGYYLELTMPNVDVSVTNGILTMQTRMVNADWSSISSLVAEKTELYYAGSIVK
ncbi:cellulase family glycosylhydrolase [Cellulosilyticum ruminicola]|uniref:cellulase family glycosylhydrolase n=1 Tax=Cellulosilyticum ruminicola TaxID=425254 RepID=UPI0006D2B373|nr:cellulase family glycosylhydrolase [Cellulosilyticum ruminicola]